eukprot:403341288
MIKQSSINLAKIKRGSESVTDIHTDDEEETSYSSVITNRKCKSLDFATPTWNMNRSNSLRQGLGQRKGGSTRCLRQSSNLQKRGFQKSTDSLVNQDSFRNMNEITLSLSDLMNPQRNPRIFDLNELEIMDYVQNFSSSTKNSNKDVKRASSQNLSQNVISGWQDLPFYNCPSILNDHIQKNNKQTLSQVATLNPLKNYQSQTDYVPSNLRAGLDYLNLQNQGGDFGDQNHLALRNQTISHDNRNLIAKQGFSTKLDGEEEKVDNVNSISQSNLFPASSLLNNQVSTQLNQKQEKSSSCKNELYKSNQFYFRWIQQNSLRKFVDLVWNAAYYGFHSKVQQKDGRGIDFNEGRFI